VVSHDLVVFTKTANHYLIPGRLPLLFLTRDKPLLFFAQTCITGVLTLEFQLGISFKAY